MPVLPLIRIVVDTNVLLEGITKQGGAPGLINVAEYTNIYFSWRPASPDPGDDCVIDCAMNAGAIVVTSNIRDFSSAKESLGLEVVTPVELIKMLLSV